MVAPHEGDAQCAYPCAAGHADGCITGDGDLQVFGCELVVYDWCARRSPYAGGAGPIHHQRKNARKVQNGAGAACPCPETHTTTGGPWALPEAAIRPLGWGRCSSWLGGWAIIAFEF